MSDNESRIGDIEFQKFKLTVELTDKQGIFWFPLSFGLVVYFWAASTPLIWNDVLGRLVVWILFVGILLVGSTSYMSKRSTILGKYETLCSRRKDREA